MKQVLLTFAGYLLITIGLSFLYLILFRKDRLPKIFTKTWFIVFVVVGSIICLLFGWMLID